jgi:hypothetical protein
VKLRAREFIEGLDPRSIQLLEAWAVRQRGILAAYVEVIGQAFSGTSRRKRGGLSLPQKFRLEEFDGDLLGNAPDDSIHGVLIGPLTKPLPREEAEAYSLIEFFEHAEEITELCREALDR